MIPGSAGICGAVRGILGRTQAANAMSGGGALIPEPQPNKVATNWHASNHVLSTWQSTQHANACSVNRTSHEIQCNGSACMWYVTKVNCGRWGQVGKCRCGGKARAMEGAR